MALSNSWLTLAGAGGLPEKCDCGGGQCQAGKSCYAPTLACIQGGGCATPPGTESCGICGAYDVRAWSASVFSTGSTRWITPGSDSYIAWVANGLTFSVDETHAVFYEGRGTVTAVFTYNTIWGLPIPKCVNVLITPYAGPTIASFHSPFDPPVQVPGGIWTITPADGMGDPVRTIIPNGDSRELWSTPLAPYCLTLPVDSTGQARLDLAMAGSGWASGDGTNGAALTDNHWLTYEVVTSCP